MGGAYFEGAYSVGGGLFGGGGAYFEGGLFGRWVYLGEAAYSGKGDSSQGLCDTYRLECCAGKDVGVQVGGTEPPHL